MKEIDIRNFDKSAVKMISDEWALLTAGDENGWNTMTVSWGGIGEVWGKDAVFVFVRPQRYTKEFIDKEGRFTLSFFGGEYKKEMGFCGKYSGRDYDKAKETGLNPVFAEDTVYIEQAECVIVCKTMYVGEFDKDKFVDKKIIEDCYENNDFHAVYVAEIEKVLVK